MSVAWGIETRQALEKPIVRHGMFYGEVGIGPVSACFNCELWVLCETRGAAGNR